MTATDPTPPEQPQPEIQPSGPQEPEIQPAETPEEMPPMETPDQADPSFSRAA